MQSGKMFPTGRTLPTGSSDVKYACKTSSLVASLAISLLVRPGTEKMTIGFAAVSGTLGTESR
jgi:hypothetical protein